MSQHQPITDQMHILACTTWTTALAKHPSTSKTVATFASLEFLIHGMSFWLHPCCLKVRVLGDNPSGSKDWSPLLVVLEIFCSFLSSSSLSYPCHPPPTLMIIRQPHICKVPLKCVYLTQGSLQLQSNCNWFFFPILTKRKSMQNLFNFFISFKEFSPS